MSFVTMISLFRLFAALIRKKRKSVQSVRQEAVVYSWEAEEGRQRAVQQAQYPAGGVHANSVLQQKMGGRHGRKKEAKGSTLWCAAVPRVRYVLQPVLAACEVKCQVCLCAGSKKEEDIKDRRWMARARSGYEEDDEPAARRQASRKKPNRASERKRRCIQQA